MSKNLDFFAKGSKTKQINFKYKIFLPEKGENMGILRSTKEMLIKGQQEGTGTGFRLTEPTRFGTLLGLRPEARIRVLRGKVGWRPTNLSLTRDVFRVFG